MSDLITPRIEMDFGAGWVDVSADVVSNVKAEWGIHGGGAKDRVADVGTMTFDLDNSSQNSGAARGYYSPKAAACRAGFGIGTPARLVLSHALFGDRVKWVGTVEAVRPSAGVRGQRAAVTCVDWMSEADRTKLARVPVQVDVQSDDLFDTIVAAVSNPPPGGSVSGSGSDVYPFALDDAQDESTKASGLLERLALSEYGYVYVAAGVLTFEGRRRRGGAGSVQLALDEADLPLTGLSVSHGRDDIANRVQVAIHPRRRDAAATADLFSLASPIKVLAGTSVVVDCQYRDPAQRAQRVGGIDMVPPVATTDYLGNSAADSSGSNLTSQLTVTADFGGSAARVTIANAGPADAFVVHLQLRGRGLYDFEPVITEATDAPSVAAFGESPLSYDMPYQSSPDNAADAAAFILALSKDERPRATSVTYLANWDDATIERAFNVEISDRVSVTAPDVGLSGEVYFVNGVRLEVRMSGVVSVTYDLAPADMTQYWLLEVPGRTELDQTTVLGYGLFVAGWLLDSSTLAADTFLA